MTELTHSAPDLARSIDHTLLRPEAIASAYEVLCLEAMENLFFSVCVPPTFVNLCRKSLKHSNVKVCTVIGFPFGYNLTATKAFEAKMAVDHGAHEIDMVANIVAIKSRSESAIIEDIRSVVRAASGHIVKVIIETCYLNEDDKRFATELIIRAGAHFVKTSTGFGPSGATLEDVALLAREANGRIGVKASGGIRDRETAIKMLASGATRLGTSQGVSIVAGKATAPDSNY